MVARRERDSWSAGISRMKARCWMQGNQSTGRRDGTAQPHVARAEFRYSGGMSGDILGKAAGVAVAVLDFLEKYNGALTAVATAFIAVFTIVLAVVTGRQARLSRESIDLARQEFIATHRPRVILRCIQGPAYNDEGQRFVVVTFVNAGANNAIIEAFGADLALRRDEDDHWEPPGLDASAKSVEPIVLASGQRHFFRVTAKTRADTDKAIFQEALGDHQLCAVGIVRYKDGNGVARHTGFFRVLADDGEAFVLSPHDAEMEYQD
jgi:hypothetical protein